MSNSGRYRLINIGYNNVVEASQVVAIVGPNSNPVRRLREAAAKAGRLVDACQGHKTRSVIVTASNHVIEAATEIKTLTERYNQAFAGHPLDAPGKDGGKGAKKQAARAAEPTVAP